VRGERWASVAVQILGPWNIVDVFEAEAADW
jgi:hypothetical protein